MFKIRQDQLEAFDRSYLLRVKRRLAAYARKRFPQCFSQTDDSALLQLIDRVWTTAQRYRIDKENDVATFLDLSIMYGEQFHQSPWARPILETDWHGPDRMRALTLVVQSTGVRL
jgi:hypothetical protein